jgi:hypothetical protein
MRATVSGEMEQLATLRAMRLQVTVVEISRPGRT